MKFRIQHESTGRIRFHAGRAHMTTAQADALVSWLGALPMVQRSTVHERTGCAIVHYNGTREDFLQALRAFSWQEAMAEPPEAAVQSSRALNRSYQERLMHMVCGKILRRVLLPRPLRLAYTLVHAVPYLRQAAGCLRRQELQVEVLDGLSIGISLLRGDEGTASSVMFLLGLGELLEEWTHKKSVNDLARSMALQIDCAWLRTPEGEVSVPLSRVHAGDCLCVHMGSVIPLDGTMVEGEAMVNQASLTGESIPVVKRPGSSVYAGTVVEEGSCILQVSRQCGQSRYDQIVAMIEQSEKLKSAAESQAFRLADRLVPYTLLGSALTFLLTRRASRGLSVLMVDFSCALKLAMPLAVLCAMGEAGQHRVAVKGGKFLEAVARADTIVFDKTGTLTHACPQVAQVIPFGGHEEAEMLRLSACLEEHFPHSIANAVVRAARERQLLHEEMHSQVEYLVAHGIASMVGESRVVIGSAHFVFEDEGCLVLPEERASFEALPPEYSHLYLAIGGVLAAVICIHDPLRQEAPAVIRQLRNLGVQHIVMLTGDSRRTAAAIAAQVGVDDYCAEVLPGDKAAYVRQAQAAGHTVIMLGDGMNDSPALSAADVGIAISDGAAIAREIADVTIPAGDLRELVRLRRLSTALMQRIACNYRNVIGFNSSLMALGALGCITPATSALLHNASTLLIGLHSMSKLLPEEG